MFKVDSIIHEYVKSIADFLLRWGTANHVLPGWPAGRPRFDMDYYYPALESTKYHNYSKPEPRGYSIWSLTTPIVVQASYHVCDLQDQRYMMQRWRITSSIIHCRTCRRRPDLQTGGRESTCRHARFPLPSPPRNRAKQ